MTVTPRDLGTFLVESRSKRNGIDCHLVDVAYVEEGHRKPKPACGCESNFIHHRVCPHIVAVADYLKEHDSKL